MPIARDETLVPPQWPDDTRNRAGYRPPTVLFDDRFDGSFCGWRDHSAGSGSTSQAYNAVSLTTARTWSDSSAALMLATSGRGTTATGATGGSASTSTYKNLSRDVNSGLVKFEAWVTVGGADLANAPLSWSLAIDSQSWDDLHRGFPRLDAIRFTGSGFTTRSNAWAIIGDAGERHYIGLDGTDRGTTVPALRDSPPMLGDNENKLNLQYVSLTYDLSGIYSADGKPGGYYECTIGPRTYDLRGFGAGRHLVDPQTNAVMGETSFAGGLNFGFQINDTPQGGAASWLIVTRARALHYKEA